MKYVIAVNQQNWFFPVVFDEFIVHEYVAKVLRKQKLLVQSAGFVYCDNGTYKVSSEISESLQLRPNIEYDNFILNLFLRDGISGLELANLVTLAELKGVI